MGHWYTYFPRQRFPPLLRLGERGTSHCPQSSLPSSRAAAIRRSAFARQWARSGMSVF